MVLIGHGANGLLDPEASWKARAAPLVNIWTKEDDDTKADQRFLHEWLNKGDLTESVTLEAFPSPDELRKTATTFGIHKACGCDALHPRQISLLDDGVLWDIIRCFQALTAMRTMSAQWAMVVMRLIPKPSSGERSVGLFTSVIRVVMRTLRRSLGASWLSRQNLSIWYGVAGKSVERAVWSRLAAISYAREVNTDAITCQFDITKAYDHIRWPIILEEARKKGLPMDLIAVLCCIHNARRLVIIDGAVIHDLRPMMSVVAGCAFADIFMYLAMNGMFENIRDVIPEAIHAVVADDYQFTIMGKPASIAQGAAKLNKAVTAEFDRLKLPRDNGKLMTLTTSNAVDVALKAAAPELRSAVVTSSRNLGIDFTLRRRRVTRVFEARLGKVKRNLIKLRQVLKASSWKRGTRFIHPTILAGSSWGAACLGVSRTQLETRRGLAHAAVARHPSGRSTTIDLALAAPKHWTLDPAYELIAAPVRALAAAIWEKWVPMAWVLPRWRQRFTRATEKLESWSSVTDPITAAFKSAARVGWTCGPAPGMMVDSEGAIIDFTMACPRTIERTMHRDTETWLLAWRTANDEDLRRWGQEALPWLEPLKGLRNHLPDYGVAMTSAAGGSWAP